VVAKVEFHSGQLLPRTNVVWYTKLPGGKMEIKAHVPQKGHGSCAPQLGRVALFLLSVVLAAQDPRGVMAGRIFDKSGAVVPGATVRITNTATGVTLSTTSNAEGYYEVQYLPPGLYTVAVERGGFKKWMRASIELHTGERLQVDANLEPGDVVETIEVTAQAPGLESSRASIDQVLTSREVTQLPVRNGSIGYLFGMAPGVVMTALPKNGPWAPGGNNGYSVGSGPIDFNLDGVSNNSVGGQPSLLPPAELVEEVQVVTTGYDASIGHTSGGAVNITLKSGSSRTRGSVAFSGSGGPMMTRDFFTNRFLFDPTTGPVSQAKIEANTPSVYWLRYTAAIGGPLRIPKLYDGRQKTFWMMGFQGHNKRRSVSSTGTMPTAAQRSGDFSSLLALGSHYQIYDPYTTAPCGPTRFCRSPLPKNIVPASRIDPAARAIVKYYPLPNSPGTADGLNNFKYNPLQPFDLYQPIFRLDHNFSERNRAYFRYSQSVFTSTKINKMTPDSTVTGRTQERPHRGIALDDVFTLSPTSVLDVRYGMTHFFTDVRYDSQGWDLREFGFSPSLLSQLSDQRRTFPETIVTGLTTLGSNGGSFSSNYSHSLLAVFSSIRGNHSLKLGFDGRLLRASRLSFGNVSPQLVFGSEYTKGPYDNSPAGPGFAQSMASLLYGLPTGGGVDINSSSAAGSRFLAGFVQDDWRVERRLTFNLGFRWEYEGPVTERYNRTTRQYDFITPNPIQEIARRQYARAPIPPLPADRFTTIGGVTFAGINGNPRGIHAPDYRGFMPRFGFAYQVSPRFVVRGGYGLFFGLIGAEFEDVRQPGFSQRTSVISSLDNGQTYIASIANPLPFGIRQPPGASLGLFTFVGASPGFFDPDGRHPYTQRWSYAMQFAVTAQTSVELLYIGSRSVRLRVTREFDAVPRNYLSTSAERDNDVINFLTSRAANPFLGLDAFAGTALGKSQNTTYAQLLQPYPHFTSLSTDIPAGSSWYHAVSVRIQQRLSRGLHFNAFYTWSKNMEATSYLNATDAIPEHIISALDRPHRFVLTAIYDLPFKGRRVWGALFGGWTVDAIYQLQAGPPIGFGNVLYRGDIHDIPLEGRERSIDRWFNTAGFERAPNKQLAYNIRSFPSRLSGVRADGINILDLAVHKNFPLRERFTLQVRGEAEGALNHPLFNPPNTNPTSTLFGMVSATQTAGDEPRRIFVGLKVLF